jgi:hypothetical protein
MTTRSKATPDTYDFKPAERLEAEIWKIHTEHGIRPSRVVVDRILVAAERYAETLTATGGG